MSMNPMIELWDINERDGLLVNRLRIENLFHESDQERMQSERMVALRQWWQ